MSNSTADQDQMLAEQLKIAFQFVQNNKKNEATKLFNELNNCDLVIENHLFDIASLAVKLDKIDEAIYWYNKIIKNTDSERKYLAYHALANIYKNLANLLEAIDCYKQAIVDNPNFQSAYIRLGNVYRGLSDNKTAINIYRQGLAIKQNSHLHTRILLAMHYDTGFSAETIFKEHQLWGEKYSQPIDYINESYITNKDRKIKLGFVSADLRLHSVSYFLMPILETINRDKFQIYLFSNTQKPDNVTNIFKSLSDRFISIYNKNDEQAVTLIKQENIDILIDLSGHTPGNRLEVFANRPAPVQISYLGYPDTTGMVTMDYRIVDDITDPTGIGEQLNTEKLLRTKNCFICFNSLDKENIFPDSNIPYTRNNYITFGSFNDITKLNNQVIKTWAEILIKVPYSRLLLKTKGLATEFSQQEFIKKFNQYGINAHQRITFIGRIPSRHAHLKYYDNIDIALDTFPYNGTTTTMQALSMGVPVISMIGYTHHSRVGYSINCAANIKELSAKDYDEYVEKAVHLANDPDKILTYKQSLREVLNKTVSNEQAFIKDFEELISSAWEKYIDITNKNIINDTDINLNCAGDFILARRMHQIYPRLPAKNILNRVLDIFKQADINLINLETVITDDGEMFAKGEFNPYYFRANTKLAELLLAMQVNIAITANNHAMDFGPDALIKQNEWLDKNHILSVGSGKNREQAKKVKYIQYNNTIIAIISFCCVQPKGLGATATQAGIFQIHKQDIAKELEAIVIEAKQHAHLIIVSPHWIENWEKEPDKTIEREARKLIDLGVDAIVGHSSHLLHRIDIYKNKPIIYDMGTFLVDTISGHKEIKYSAIFQLGIVDNSLISIKVIPIILNNNNVTIANTYESNFIFNKILTEKKLNHSITENKLLILLNQTYNTKEIKPIKTFTPKKSHYIEKSYPDLYINKDINNLFYTIKNTKIVETFRAGGGFKIEIDFFFNQTIHSIYEVEIYGLCNDYTEKTFTDTHPISNGIYDNLVICNNKIIKDNYLVRVNRTVKPGKYKIYWSIVYKENNTYVKNNLSEEKSYLGDIYIMPDGIPRKASGIDWSGHLDYQLKSKFDVEYFQSPELAFLKWVKLKLLTDNHSTFNFSSYAIEEKYTFNQQYSLTYLSLYNKAISPPMIRWGSIRNNLVNTVNRNIERIKINSNYKKFDSFGSVITIELVTKEHACINMIEDVCDSNHSHSGIKLIAHDKEYILPLSECIQHNLSTLEEKVNFLMDKNNLMLKLNDVKIFRLDFAIFSLANGKLFNTIESISSCYQQ